MKIRSCQIFILLFVVFVQFETTAQIDRSPETDPVYFEEYLFPASVGFVNDFENIFSFDEREELERIISDYEKETSREIAVITIASIEPYDNIKDYATALSNKWGVGKPEKDNGLTIVLSSKLRKIRIATGYGTERILTDEICKNIIDEIMIPEFKNGDYYSGVEKGVLELIRKWN